MALLQAEGESTETAVRTENQPAAQERQQHWSGSESHLRHFRTATPTTTTLISLKPNSLMGLILKFH